MIRDGQASAPRWAGRAGLGSRRRGKVGYGILGKGGLLVFLCLAGAPLLGALGRIGLRGLAPAFVEVLRSKTSWRALGFALSQAGASLGFALLLGIPGAWLVARYRFPGRRLLKALAAVPFCIPPVLVVLAFVLYYGRGGYLNRSLMRVFRLADPPMGFLYSFWGLVLVHGFYNFPIILESLGSVWAALPRDREEAARTLGAGRFRSFLTGTLPALAPSLAEASALVFLFCFFSFVVVLVFGPLGGSTLEVEIYRLARLEADGRAAAALALFETGIALLVVLAISFAGRRARSVAARLGPETARAVPRGPAFIALIVYALILIVFFAGPLVALVIEAFTQRRGMVGFLRLGMGNFKNLLRGAPSAGIVGALLDTLSTALPAAFLATMTGGFLALGLRGRHQAVENFASLPLAISGVVSALGWSFLFPAGGRGLIILIEGLGSLPFALRSVSAALSSLDREPSRAARLLGASRIRASLEIELPALLPSFLSAAAFSFSLAAGDATSPLLLGIPDFEPLPLLVYRLVGAYRFPEACAAGLVLAILAGFVFFAKDQEVFRA